MKAIGDIKKELSALSLISEKELEAFVGEYAGDERQGVLSLVEKARKNLQKLADERTRLFAMREFERKYDDYQYICGIDEVGRGPLAGPVMAGAVILPKDCEILYINDSKKLSEKKREELSEEIKEKALAWAIGVSDQSLIDEVNILQATFAAMRSAIGKLGIRPDILLNDAVSIPEVDIKQVGIIKGDAKSVSIAAASIIAKVERDHFMVEMDKVYPGYDFASNKGYGSAAHIAALKKNGPTPIHRQSFIGNFI